MSLISQGLLVSGLGLAGVFAVLILFFVLTKVILAISKKVVKEGETK
jgi:Na+-transporting methylmalonyl-CoA/oxaloacetate decarboxylase gamma subunit